MWTDFAFIVGAAAMALATTEAVGLFFAGRAIEGLALGGAGAIASSYMAEISPPAKRGAYVTMIEFGLCGGCLMAYCAAAALGDAQWRLAVVLPAALALCQLVCTCTVLVESPRWLAHASSHGHAEACAAAAALGLAPPPLDAAAATLPLAKADSTPQPLPIGILRLLWRHRRPLCIALGIAVAHGTTVANSVLYYARDVFQDANLSDPRLANLMVGVVKFLGAAASVWLVDRWGRRKLLIVGSVLMAGGHLGLSLAFGPLSGSATAEAATATSSLLVFVFAWNLSWGGLMMTVAAEMLPQAIRGLGTGLVYAVYWSLSFAASMTLESTFEALGLSATFAMYGGTTLLALGYAAVCVPELKGAAVA